ncbi:MAG: type II toxin-antitoxin system VapC family toxin [Candidatus Diapherotrites archaeon]|jgi:predicted nucleic acid-binding protein|uniref:Type II toxin-antitoxin system VapC family toxin n=1 Tax=Candidatus Iainarchaeum sp. TaxID=3101447 RepID=A0A7K4BYK3_9ARCH|nr:type II toxin-antitoxin system VapC family toxin [Candidatus Diapherotrites archaeon]
MQYFADSYAIIEFLKENKNYKKYFEQHEIITTKFNLMEVYYSSLIEKNKNYADKVYSIFLPNCVEVPDAIIHEAMLFKLAKRKNNISYIDAIGYTIAKEMRVKFLTGDKEFRNLENVEFVK